jgi:hypothetical protein
MKVFVFAQQSVGMKHVPVVQLTVETQKIYDIVITPMGLSYSVNSSAVSQLPNCPSKQVLENFYAENKPTIDEFLTFPNNDNWWKVKHLEEK